MSGGPPIVSQNIDDLEYDGEKVVPNKVDSSIVELLEVAGKGDVKKLAELIEANPESMHESDGAGRNALHFCVHHNQIECVTWLLDHGAEIDKIDKDDFTPLIRAVKLGFRPIVELLVARGADVNHTTRRGSTAIHEAASNKDSDMVAYLFDHGAVLSDADKAEKQDMGGPLHRAAESGALDIARLFLEKGANPNAADGRSVRPLHYAAGTGDLDMARLLLENGADVNCLIDVMNISPLHMATDFGNVEMVKLLIEHGAVQFADNDNQTPYDVACEKDNNELAALLQSVPLHTAAALGAEDQKALGNQAFKARRYVDAAKYYSRAIGSDPTNGAYYSNRAAAYFNLGKFDKALSDAEKCVELKPEWPRGYFRMAMAQWKLGAIADAVTSANAGLEFDPENAELKGCLEKIAADADA